MPTGTTLRYSRSTDRRVSGISGRSSIGVALAIDLIAGGLGVAKPIVFVSGFWRSGTTWLQELLAESLRAKTVFEPLCPQNPVWHRHLMAMGVAQWDLKEAFIPGRADANDPMWTYLDRTFSAAIGSEMSVKCRSAVSELFRRAIIVKDVRLQLNLETIHRRYDVPVVHLRRHPCAVTSSLMSARWPWSFDAVRLPSLLAPLVDDLRDEDLPSIADLEPFDGDTVSRIAAFWAITECLAERRVRNRPWAVILPYEDAVLDPVGTIHDLCKLIGRRPARVGNPNLELDDHLWCVARNAVEAACAGLAQPNVGGRHRQGVPGRCCDLPRSAHPPGRRSGVSDDSGLLGQPPWCLGDSRSGHSIGTSRQ